MDVVRAVLDVHIGNILMDVTVNSNAPQGSETPKFVIAFARFLTVNDVLAQP